MAKPITVSKLTGGMESGFTRSVRAAQIREATLAVCRAKQWTDVARSAEEYAQAQRTYARATTWLCNINLQTCEEFRP